MNKKLYHLEYKSAKLEKRHFYYGDLTILYNSHNDIKLKSIDELNDKVPCMFKLDPKVDLIN